MWRTLRTERVGVSPSAFKVLRSLNLKCRIAKYSSPNPIKTDMVSNSH